MRALLRRLEWDELLLQQLQSVRLVFMPIVNPGGMWANTRSNPNGVDLMRNAPQNAEGRVPFLAGGSGSVRGCRGIAERVTPRSKSKAKRCLESSSTN